MAWLLSLIVFYLQKVITAPMVLDVRGYVNVSTVPRVIMSVKPVCVQMAGRVSSVRNPVLMVCMVTSVRVCA